MFRFRTALEITAIQFPTGFENLAGDKIVLNQNKQKKRC